LITATVILCLQSAPLCDASAEVSRYALSAATPAECLQVAEEFVARVLPDGYQFVVECGRKK
jgi:hypothetical protein